MWTKEVDHDYKDVRTRLLMSSSELFQAAENKIKMWSSASESDRNKKNVLSSFLYWNRANFQCKKNDKAANYLKKNPKPLKLL